MRSVGGEGLIKLTRTVRISLPQLKSWAQSTFLFESGNRSSLRLRSLVKTVAKKREKNSSPKKLPSLTSFVKTVTTCFNFCSDIQNFRVWKELKAIFEINLKCVEQVDLDIHQIFYGTLNNFLRTLKQGTAAKKCSGPSRKKKHVLRVLTFSKVLSMYKMLWTFEKKNAC